MTNEKNIKEQRDRFLAFSFASSDLFIEVNEGGKISYALGAAMGLTGADDASLLGMNWLELFARIERPTLIAFYAKAKPVQRCGPILVNLDPQFGEGRRAILTAIRMPDSPKFYVTLGFTSVLMARTGEMLKIAENSALLDKDTFLYAAREAINIAGSLNRNIDLTLLDFPGVSEFKQKIGMDAWQEIRDAIGGFLKSRSVDGQSAAELTEGRYSILHDKEIESELLRTQLAEIIRQASDDGDNFEVNSKTVTSELDSLSERDASKALVYTVNEFERKGTGINIKTLNTGFRSYAEANTEKARQLKHMVTQLNFDMEFQPIVDINNGYEATHFEILSRFPDGGSVLEWIIFVEDTGMAPEFDMAVVERALNYLKYKSSGRRSRFAVNISSRSIQDSVFFEKLLKKLTSSREFAERIILEITESSEIEDLGKAADHLATLRSEGFKVCLDDFDPASASFQYLQTLKADYLKIDGSYTKKIMHSERDTGIVKNIISICRDLGIGVMVEMLENEEQLYRLRHLGAEYAQGYLFARPGRKPEYDRPKSLNLDN